MKTKIFNALVLLLIIPLFSGCTFTTTGDSLEAFSRRMNELNEQYNMTSEGYIIDDIEGSLIKFFKFNEKELMLNFKYDKKNRITEMNIVFAPEIFEESPNAFTFVYDCIKCFCYNEKATAEILKATDFENTIREIKMETTSAESDNIKIEIDTTRLGTVISIYKDI